MIKAPPPIPSPRQLRTIRAWFGIKQPDFARNCSISHSALAGYELGRRKTSQDVLMAIARYVDTRNVKFDDVSLTFDHGATSLLKVEKTS